MSFTKRALGLFALTSALALVMSGIAFADNLQDQLSDSGTATFAAGESTTLHYRIVGNGTDGCNVDGTHPATAQINPEAGLTANPPTLTFTSCGTYQDVVFSAGAAGTYDVRPTISGGKLSGNGWNTNPANATIIVTDGGVGTEVDVTAPVITITTPEDGATYEHHEVVNADYSCQDEAGGTGVDTCEGTVADGAAIDTSTLGSHDFTVDTSDEAGNTDTETVSYTVIDVTAPVITITTPRQGATYRLGQSVLADFACAEEAGGSGLASCAGTVADGSALNTSSVGQKSFTVTTSDLAGNTDSETVTYSVVYDWRGFFAPVDNLPTRNVVKAGQAVPIKFSLGGNQGLNIFMSGYPGISIHSCTAAPSDAVETTLTAGNSSLNYDASAGQYIYVWKTDKSWAGSCRTFTIRLIDGTYHQADFSFTR